MLSLQLGASLAVSLFAAVGAQGATALRLGVSTLLLGVWFRAWRGAVPRTARPWLLAYGASLGCMNLLFYLALRSVPLGVAVALEFIGPLGLSLWHSRHPRDLAWVGLALAGLWLLLPAARLLRHADPGGALCALAAGLCWAAYMVSGAKAGLLLGRRAVPLGVAIAAAITLPIGFARAGAHLFAPALLPRALAVAVLSSALPYSLEMVALTRLPTRLMGLLTSAEPALAALAGWLLLGQAVGPRAAIGIGAIMLAGAGAVLERRAT